MSERVAPDLQELVAAALEWAEYGVPVFPTNANKVPLTKNGHKDGSTDPDRIREMFEQAGSRCYGIGAAMGKACGMFAIDADIYKGGGVGQQASDYIDELVAKGLLPETRTHATQSGGIHYLLYSEKAWPNVKPCPGVEVKGEGGYIIVPPSPGYSVVTSELVSVADAPDALLHQLSAKRAEASNQSVSFLKSQILSADSFHDALTQLSARLSGAQEPPERVQGTLLETLRASVAANPDHPRHGRWKALMADKDGELSRIVASGHKKYHPDSGSEALRDALLSRGGGPTLPSGMGMFIPARIEEEAASEAPVAPVDPEAYGDGDDWPFPASAGYFGHDDLDVLQQKYVIHPILSEYETTILSAEPKAGKTLLLQTLCMHLACGKSFGTLDVKEPRPVLYFALEGQLAVKRRLAAWKQKNAPEIDVGNPDVFPFYVYERPTNLLDPEARKKLTEQIIAANKYFIKRGFAPLGAIVFDTLTKTMPGGDQNSVEDTSAVFEVIGLLREHGISAAALFAHHDNKQGGVRGSSNILAEPDTLLGLKKDPDRDGELIMNIRMARSIEDDEVYRFKITGHMLGHSPQGYEIKAPILLPATDAEVMKEEAAQRLVAADREQEMLEAVARHFGRGEHSTTTVHAFLRETFPETYPLAKTKANSGKFMKYWLTKLPEGTFLPAGKGSVIGMVMVKPARLGVAKTVRAFVVKRVMTKDEAEGEDMAVGA